MVSIFNHFEANFIAIKAQLASWSARFALRSFAWLLTRLLCFAQLANCIAMKAQLASWSARFALRSFAWLLTRLLCFAQLCLLGLLSLLC